MVSIRMLEIFLDFSTHFDIDKTADRFGMFSQNVFDDLIRIGKSQICDSNFIKKENKAIVIDKKAIENFFPIAKNKLKDIKSLQKNILKPKMKKINIYCYDVGIISKILMPNLKKSIDDKVMDYIYFESFDNVTQSGKCDSIDINISADFIGGINLDVFSKRILNTSNYAIYQNMQNSIGFDMKSKKIYVCKKDLTYGHWYKMQQYTIKSGEFELKSVNTRELLIEYFLKGLGLIYCPEGIMNAYNLPNVKKIAKPFKTKFAEIFMFYLKFINHPEYVRNIINVIKNAFY